jgi:hypothetical protein
MVSLDTTRKGRTSTASHTEILTLPALAASTLLWSAPLRSNMINAPLKIIALYSFGAIATLFWQDALSAQDSRGRSTAEIAAVSDESFKKYSDLPVLVANKLHDFFDCVRHARMSKHKEGSSNTILICRTEVSLTSGRLGVLRQCGRSHRFMFASLSPSRWNSGATEYSIGAKCSEEHMLSIEVEVDKQATSIRFVGELMQ